MDIDVRANDHHGGEGVQPRPLHFIQRGEDIFAPLVALDQLPAWLNVDGVPKVFSGQDISNCHGTVVACQTLEGGYDVRVGHDMNGYRTPPELEAVQHAATGPDSPLTTRDRVSTPKQRIADPRYQPVTRGIFGEKRFCTHWIRTGECDFMQQGCMFLHQIPDTETLQQLGFKSYPRWFREMPGAYQMANAVGLDSMCPKEPFRHTGNVRDTATQGPRGHVGTGHAAANNMRHSWPYSTSRSAYNHRDGNRHVSAGAAYDRMDRDTERYESRRSTGFNADRSTVELPPNALGDIRGANGHAHSRPHVAGGNHEAGDAMQHASDDYVATPRPYDDSGDEGYGNNANEANGDHRRSNDSTDRSRPMSRAAEHHEPHELSASSNNMSPQNFYVEPTPTLDRRHQRHDKRTHGGWATDGKRARRHEQRSSSPVYDHAGPSVREREREREHHGRHDSRLRPVQREVKDTSGGRPIRRNKATSRSAAYRERQTRELPRLQYPPTSRERRSSSAAEEADFYVRVDAHERSRKPAEANDGAAKDAMSDLISFD